MFTHSSGLSRAFPTSKTLRGRHLFLSHHAHEDQFVEWTSGCCLLIPRATIDRVGMLSERWFLYIEDTEYCKRVLDAGLKIKVLAKAHAFHEVGGSAQVAEDADADDSDDVETDAEAKTLSSRRLMSARCGAETSTTTTFRSFIRTQRPDWHGR